MDTFMKAAFIDFVNRCFRDVADRDYIAARMAHRYGLDQQFLWLALQAVEKYLKAILIYNRKSTKDLRHRVKKAYERVLSISDIAFDFPRDIERFIDYLDKQGNNRYFEYPYYTMGDELLLLDKTIWNIRRYSFNLRGKLKLADGSEMALFQTNLRMIQSNEMKQHPNKYKIFGGFLENVLSQKGSKIREHLVWKNFYYGTYGRKRLRRYALRSVSGNPTHSLHPEVFPELEKYVTFSKEVRDYFKGLPGKTRQQETSMES